MFAGCQVGEAEFNIDSASGETQDVELVETLMELHVPVQDKLLI